MALMMCYKTLLANFFGDAVYLGAAGKEDALWVAQCLRGDPAAFEPLVRKYERVLFSVALRLVGDYEDARDATQNTFIRAFERLDRFDPDRKFFSWIYRIAVNECLNFRRSRKAQEPLTGEFEVPPGSFEALQALEARERVDEALEALSSEYREVVVLRYFAELSYEEISEATGVPEKTVKSRLFSARQRLAALLGADDGDESNGE
jgi:RNA polymerase sigma-70 factor, ECF subfamily